MDLIKPLALITHKIRLSPFSKVFIFVMCVHMAALAGLFYLSTPSFSKPKPLSVKTITLKPPAKNQLQKTLLNPPQVALITTPTAMSSKANQTKPSEPEVSLKKNKTTQPTVSTKKTSSKPAPQEQKKKAFDKPSHVVDPQLLKNAISNLQQLKFNSPSASSAQNDEQGLEPSYEQTLVHFLRLWIRLPEYGSVTLRLCLDRQGKVVQMQTLDCKSERNRLAIEERIKQLTFPVVEKAFSGQAEKSLVLVLSNE